MAAHRIKIAKDGTVKFIYADALASVVKALPAATVTRVSNVEPFRGGWIADMTLSGGPILFVDCEHDTPFALRQQALNAEVSWLREHRGL